MVYQRLGNGRQIHTRETVRNWRNKYRETYLAEEAACSSQDHIATAIWKRPGRPGMLNEVKLKHILNNLRTAGCAISRKVVISVGNGVLQSKCPDKMRKNGGNITLSIKWSRGLI